MQRDSDSPLEPEEESAGQGGDVIEGLCLEYRIAVFCGASPLAVGISIFLIWLITSWDWLIFAGIWTILIGSALFVVGVASLIAAFVRAPRTASNRKSAVSAARLLLLNFPVAFAIVLLVGSLPHEGYPPPFTVVVRNESSRHLRGVEIYGIDWHSAMLSVPSGGTSHFVVPLEGEGPVRFKAVSAEFEYAGMFIGYCTNGQTGNAVVTVQADGASTVERSNSDTITQRWPMMTDSDFLAQSIHTPSGRTALIDHEVDTVWLYLVDAERNGIEATAWLFNLIEAPLEVLKTYRERDLPPPVTAGLAGPGAHCLDLERLEWKLLWSQDGSAVAALADGVCVGFITADAKGFSRHLLAESGWGSPWSATLYESLFGREGR